MPSSTRPAWLYADRTKTKVRSSGSMSSLHICLKCSRALLPCPCIANPASMAFQDTKFFDGILLNTLQASSMLPHFAYMVTRLLPTTLSDSQLLWIICSWAHLPASSPTSLAHAFRTPTKVTWSGCNPSCCIHQEHFQCLIPLSIFQMSK